MDYKSETLELYEKIAQQQKREWEQKLDEKEDSFWDEALSEETPLKSRQQQKKELKEVLLSPLNPGVERVIINGLALVMEQCRFILTSTEAETLQSELQTVAKKLLEGKLVPKGELPLGDAFQLSSTLLSLIQKMGDHFYNKQQYSEARTLFLFLAHLLPYIPQYWLSLGHTEKALDRIKEASSAYILAGATGLNDPLPYLLAAYINTKEDKELARMCLDTAKAILSQNNLKGYEEEIRNIENKVLYG